MLIINVISVRFFVFRRAILSNLAIIGIRIAWIEIKITTIIILRTVEMILIVIYILNFIFNCYSIKSYHVAAIIRFKLLQVKKKSIYLVHAYVRILMNHVRAIINAYFIHFVISFIVCFFIISFILFALFNLTQKLNLIVGAYYIFLNLFI
jgi:hypothetical protein